MYTATTHTHTPTHTHTRTHGNSGNTQKWQAHLAGEVAAFHRLVAAAKGAGWGWREGGPWLEWRASRARRVEWDGRPAESRRRCETARRRTTQHNGPPAVSSTATESANEHAAAAAAATVHVWLFSRAVQYIQMNRHCYRPLQTRRSPETGGSSAKSSGLPGVAKLAG